MTFFGSFSFSYIFAISFRVLLKKCFIQGLSLRLLCFLLTVTCIIFVQWTEILVGYLKFIIILTLALVGELLRAPPPVFRYIEKNGGSQRRRFLHTLSAILFAPFLKILSLGHLRSGQVTPPPKKFVILQQLQFLSNQYETFRISLDHQ